MKIYALLDKQNVIGFKEFPDLIEVYVTQKVDLDFLSKSDVVPAKVKGKLTDVIEIGVVNALHRGRHRPSPGGTSIGHYLITTGTFGCALKHDGVKYILSNNHVLANSNSAKIGDPILQPGASDFGNIVTDRIATLYKFVPIVFEGSGNKASQYVAAFFNGIFRLFGSTCALQSIQSAHNTVDCALALPTKQSDILLNILDVGYYRGFNDAVAGESIKKSGRTTALTRGAVFRTGVTVTVNYGGGKKAIFENQIMMHSADGAVGAGGDSGSVILNNNDEVIGLLFAGGEIYTFANPIADVLQKLLP